MIFDMDIFCNVLQVLKCFRSAIDPARFATDIPLPRTSGFKYLSKRNLLVAETVLDRQPVPVPFEGLGCHFDAIKGFQSLVYRFPADEYADDAQYYLGLCYMKKKDYSSAINEFRILLESYPYSEWVDETVLMMATAYFEKSPSPDRDQTDTETALELARQFLIKFPHSELRAEAESLILKCKSKLARKLLIAIDTFVKLGKYKAAEVYLDIIDSEYPDVPEIWDAKYYRALVYSKTGRVDEAEDILTQILEDKNAPREVRAKAGALIWKVRG